MNVASKITLSAEELQLVNNPDWILTKRNIIEKVVTLLGELSQQQINIIGNTHLPASSPKISKGENYLHLPYVILDYPRYFNTTDIFAIRTMFWWGHHFSVTLQLAGNYKKQFEQALIHNIPLLQQQQFYYCINEDMWQHHFEKSNYLPAAAMPASAIAQQFTNGQFIKLAQQFKLTQFNEIPELLSKSFLETVQLLTI
jgi:hypothetical protein